MACTKKINSWILLALLALGHCGAFASRVAAEERSRDNARKLQSAKAALSSQSAKLEPVTIGLIFAGISAAAAVAGVAVAATQSTPSGTVNNVCNNCCYNCGGSAAAALSAPPPPPSINGCTSESCLCAAAGPGVRANIFDPTCSTFFNCPGPKQPCGPGTLFNAQYNVCDWPSNVKCAAIRS